MIGVFFPLVLFSSIPVAGTTISTNEQLAEIIDIQAKLLAEYDEKLKSVESNFRAIIDNQNKKIDDQNKKIDGLQQMVEETKSDCGKEFLPQKNSEHEDHTEPNLKGMDTVVEKRLLVTTGRTQVPERPSIAFSAHMSQEEFSLQNLTNRHTLIFDVIQTNVGGGYNKANGIFVAPESGVYVLTWTLHYHHPFTVCTVLDINGVVSGKAISFSDSGIMYSHTSSTSVVVVHMNKADVAFIRTNKSGCPNSGSIISGNFTWSSFSGWLLF